MFLYAFLFGHSNYTCKCTASLVLKSYSISHVHINTVHTFLYMTILLFGGESMVKYLPGALLSTP